jgi:Flp pilus assembly protein TadD
VRAIARALAIVALAVAACAHRPPPQSPTLRVRLAMANELARRGEPDAALDLAEAARHDAPHDPEVLVLRGRLLCDRDLLDEAEADLREALLVAPESADAHAAFAVLMERRHDARESEVHHRRAVELAPGNARYLNNLGYSLLLHGDARAAIPVLLDAARTEPGNARVRNNLGFAYALAGDFPRAARQFALGGTASEAKNNLGYAYERTGNLAQAREHYRQALEIEPGLRNARDNLDRLEARPGRPSPGAAPAEGVAGADTAPPGGRP